MGLISLIRGRCWHDWYYEDKAGRHMLSMIASSMDPTIIPIIGSLGYHKRTCLKCGKCEDTITSYLVKRKEELKACTERAALGKKMWEERCQRD